VGQDIIERLVAEAVVFQLGAQNPNPTGSPFTLPKITGGVTSYWLAEDGFATKSTMGFGQVAWQPHRLMTHTKLSRQLVQMSNPSAEAIVRNDMATSMALAVDLAALEGTGADGQPLGLVSSGYLTAAPKGLLGTAQRLQSSTNGDPLTWTVVQNLIGILEDANALRGRLGFATNPKVMRKLRLQTAEMYSAQAAGLGMPIFAPLISDQVIETQTGYPWRKTTQISIARTKGSTNTCGTLYFGNWNEMIIPTWGALEFRASDTTGDSTGSALTGDLLWIVGKMLCDVNIRHAESFAFNPELTTA
jgi:HK97 family phage major capsid protein